MFAARYLLPQPSQPKAPTAPILLVDVTQGKLDIRCQNRSKVSKPWQGVKISAGHQTRAGHQNQCRVLSSYHKYYEAQPPIQDPNDSPLSQSSNRTAYQHSMSRTLKNLFSFANSKGYLIRGCFSINAAKSSLDRKR